MMYPNEQIEQDEYGEVLNSDKTYQGIADQLQSAGSVVIGWTDGLGSHMDVLFVVNPIQAGGLQRGMSWSDLFVAVSHFGMFGFEINKEDTHHGYIGEKLGVGDGPSTEKLAELINGVKKRL